MRHRLRDVGNDMLSGAAERDSPLSHRGAERHKYRCQVSPSRNCLNSEKFLTRVILSCHPPWPSLYGNTTGLDVFPNTTESTVLVIADNGTAIFEATIPVYCDVLNGNISSGTVLFSDPLIPHQLNLLLVPFTCPSGFYLVGTDSCAFDCPSPLLDATQFDAITIMLRLNILFCYFCFLTYFLASCPGFL